MVRLSPPVRALQTSPVLVEGSETAVEAVMGLRGRGTQLNAGGSRRRRVLTVLLGAALALVAIPSTPAQAAPVLTITPLTWNVIGLDSNRPATGPDTFPVGARV